MTDRVMSWTMKSWSTITGVVLLSAPVLTISIRTVDLLGDLSWKQRLVVFICAMVAISVVVIWACFELEGRQKRKAWEKRWAHVGQWQGNGSLDSMFYLTWCSHHRGMCLVTMEYDDDLCGGCGAIVKIEGTNSVRERRRLWRREQVTQDADEARVAMEGR